MSEIFLLVPEEPVDLRPNYSPYVDKLSNPRFSFGVY